MIRTLRSMIGYRALALPMTPACSHDVEMGVANALNMHLHTFRLRLRRKIFT
jgi:hypothetical protein